MEETEVMHGWVWVRAGQVQLCLRPRGCVKDVWLGSIKHHLAHLGGNFTTPDLGPSLVGIGSETPVRCRKIVSSSRAFPGDLQGPLHFPECPELFPLD